MNLHFRLINHNSNFFALTIACAIAFIFPAYSFSQDILTAKSTKSTRSVQALDTLNKISPVQNKDTASGLFSKQKADSTGQAVTVPNAVDSSMKKAALAKPAIAEEDTASLFLKVPYFNFGIGWSLGSFDLFNEWQKALPDSANDILSLNPDTLLFSVREPVNTYNILFPISVSFTPFVYSRSSMGFEASFYYIEKNIQAALARDTAFGKMDYKQSMSSYGFSLGAIYRHAIDERYVRIENVDRTSIVLGIFAQPYVHMSKDASISSSGVSDSVVAAAQSRIQKLGAWGFGCAWRVGVCSQKALSRASGMEVSISYIGRYANFFRSGSGLLLNKTINPAAGNPDEKVSFFSHMVELRLEFLVGKSHSRKTKS